MAFFGRLTNSIFQGVAENTNALANFNFDFTVVRLEAPREFQELSSALTKTRKDNAEQGVLHSTARKLGALFQSSLPSTPLLLKNYGLRASEIGIKASKHVLKTASLFREQAGVDGSSIWAAATSGPGAIQCHLLACVLARVWSSSEAISIWVELIEKRKAELEAQMSDGVQVDLNSALAGQQNISRDQIAEWDSSARSWLQVADKAKSSNQSRIMDVVGQLEQGIKAILGTYQSVLSVFNSNLEGMESLLQGSPMRMESPEILLGLASWHLYPDINTLDPVDPIISQNDPLVPPSGILTVGLQADESSIPKGLTWSLPLAHLRYYGDPVRRTRSLDAESLRLSVEHFEQAILGCVLGGWGVNDANVDDTIKWVVDICSRLEVALASAQLDSDNSWVTLLKRAAISYVNSKNITRRKFARLVRLGRKHASFIGKPPLPYFGLAEFKHFVRLTRGQEAKIQCLRAIAARTGLQWDQLIIRYISDETGAEEYATAMPQPRTSAKRTVSESSKSTSGHIRWVTAPEDQLSDDASGPMLNPNAFMGFRRRGFDHENIDMLQEAASKPMLELSDYTAIGEETRTAEQDYLLTIFKMRQQNPRVLWAGKHKENFITRGGGLPDYEPWQGGAMCHHELLLGDTTSAALFVRLDLRVKEDLRVGFEDLRRLFAEDSLDESFLLRVFLDGIDENHEKFVKNLRAVATMSCLYQEAGGATIDVRILERSVSVMSWTTHIGRERWDSSAVTDNEQPVQNIAGPEAVKLIGALDDTELSQIGIDSQVASMASDSPMEESAFAEAFEHTTHTVSFQPAQGLAGGGVRQDLIDRCLNPGVIDQETAFSCILMFNYCFDLPKQQLKDVMAISSGNSLFVARQLLCDPAKRPRSWIKHVMGNVGRPGIALLRPPIAPRIKQLEIGSWNLLNHDPWDGDDTDHFSNSSLHLWFTGSKVPIDVGHTGAQDVELYMLETVVSLYGHNKWIADLDILKALNSPKLALRASAKEPCDDNCSEARSRVGSHAANLWSSSWKRRGARAIQDWIELLDSEEENSVLLARGNWQARLAAVAICCALGRKVCIMDGDMCFECFQRVTRKAEPLVCLI